jgi:GT2 family glycosyltransferase
LISRAGKKIVLLGMMTRIPVAGVVWQTIHYLIGFERLGYEVYYVETHARTPTMLMQDTDEDSSVKAASFIDSVMRRFDLGDHWAFVGLHDDGGYYGKTEAELKRLYGEAVAIINLHGGTQPLPELYATDRFVYVETDPVLLQLELHSDLQQTIDFLEPHSAFFTFAENLGNPDCLLPSQNRFALRPTRQPVVLDFWRDRDGDRSKFTTIGNWRQPWRDVTWRGERYSWSKHDEFLKYLDVPTRTGQEFELALSSSSFTEDDRRTLEQHGWAVRDALEFSSDADAYRDYVVDSRGEFTVAKEQNVRLRTGWFSDRSATYLAAGRPVVCQDTAFGAALPTGEGLFAFESADEAVAAVQEVNGDYARQSRAAAEIAHEFFDSDRVLTDLLDQIGEQRALLRSGVRATAARSLFPPGMVLEPISRRPTELAPETISAVLARMPGGGSAAVAAEPAASIVMVTLDNEVFLRMSLASLLADDGGPPIEVIVVDNGSRDGTADFLRRLASDDPRVRVVLNEGNAGFARGCNQGLAIARGDLLVLLNDDALVPPGWLSRLSAHLDSPGVGLAGPVTNRIGNEAEVEVDYRTWGGFLQAAARRAWERSGERFEIPTLTMFCLALRRPVFYLLGPLDQGFEIGMLEDDDYSERAHEAGLATVCAEDVLVHHFGETSFGKLVPTGEYAALLAANKRRFEEKWGKPWQPYERRQSATYEGMTERIKRIVADAVPARATVLIVSRGDDELLELEDRRGRHFPEAADGTWAGHHPADSAEAVASLEAMRASGGNYIVFPQTGMWWLDFYEGLREHLESRYRAVVRDAETCVIFQLDDGGPETG